MPPILVGARLVARDQPRDDGDVPEGAAQHGGFRHPGFQVVAQQVLLKKFCDIIGLPCGPGGQHVVGRDEAERLEAEALHALGQQHAERLVRVTALKTIRHHVPLSAARKRFDQQVFGAGQAGADFLQFEPFPYIFRK